MSDFDNEIPQREPDELHDMYADRPSPAPLTEAERLAAEALAAVGNRDYVWAGPGYFDASDWEDEARAVVAAVRPALWSEAVAFLRSIADEDGVRLAADILDNAALSLPASKETQQ